MGIVITGTQFGRELTAAEEFALGRAIRAAENVAFEALEGVEEVAAILGRRASGRYRTHAAAVERLEDAVAKVKELAKTDPKLVPAARAAGKAWEEADALRWKLAMSQQRIAFHEARKLGGRLMERADLAQEGVLGLLRAARRFDPERGLRFSTYARWWVRAQLTRTIDQHGRVVRLPGAAVEQLRNLRKAQVDHERRGGDYSIAELANEAGVEVERAEFLLSRGEAVSLDEPADDDGRPTGAQYADESNVDALDAAIGSQHGSLALRALEKLDPRQRDLLACRFGLFGVEPLSLSEVGRRLALSRERVRQLEKEAIAAVQVQLAAG